MNIKKHYKNTIILFMALVLTLGNLPWKVFAEPHHASSKNEYERNKYYWRMRRLNLFYAEEYIEPYDDEDPFADPPYYNFRDTYEYYNIGGIIYGIKLKKNQQFHGSIGPVDKDNPYNITIQSMELLLENMTGFPSGIQPNKPMGRVILDGVNRNYKYPVAHTYRWVNEFNMGYDMPYWFVVKLQEYKTSVEKRQHEEATRHLWDKWISKYTQLINKAEEIEAQGQPKKAGDYYLRDAEFLRRAAYEWNILLTDNYFYFMDPRIENDRGKLNPKRFSYDLEPDQIEEIIDTIDDVLRYIENNRVKELEILSYEIDGYVGNIDYEKKEILLNIPKGKELDFSKATVETPRGILSKFNVEASTDKEKIYSLYAVEPLYYNTFYDNQLIKDEPYKDTETQWKVILEYGEEDQSPKINALHYVAFDGRNTTANIDHDKGEIKLDIPFDIENTEATVDIYFSGEYIRVDQPTKGHEGVFTYKHVEMQTIDYGANEKIPRERTKLLFFDMNRENKITILKGDREKTYTLIVRRVPSDDNRILSCGVQGAERVILDQKSENIKVILPFDYEGHDFKPSFTISKGATIEPQEPIRQKINEEVEYTITSESGKSKTYKVVAEKLVASSERKILMFAIGNLEAEINELNHTITLDLPRNMDLNKLKPYIYVSKYASISPNSDEEQNFFEGPVIYTVTAQNGETQEYTVTITANGVVEVGPSDSAIIKTLSDMNDTVYVENYRTNSNEFLEWINKGIYEGIQNGIKDEKNPDRDGYRIKPDHIPEGLDLVRVIAKTNSNRLEEIAKTTMIMTSMGMDATSLGTYSGYFGGYGWEKDKKQTAVSDLVREIYNFKPKGRMTLTEYVYGLMALDMGNYNVPRSAPFNREKFIEEILKASLTKWEPTMGGTILKGVDRSTMVIQALAPYQDHPIYGSRVKAKIEEALEYIIENIGDSSIGGKMMLFSNGGQPDSVSGARAINALISIGIDPFTDPRFAKDDSFNVLLNWFNHHKSNPYGFGRYGNDYNKEATMYDIYALQNYLKFVESGGGIYIPHIHSVPFNFEKILNSEARIDFVEFLGKFGAIDDAAGIVKIYVPMDTLDEDLIDKSIYIDYSDNGKISPDPDGEYDFTKPVTFTVTSEDGENSKTYTIIVERREGIDSGRNDIEDVSVIGIPKASVRIDNTNKEVEIVLPSDTEEDVLNSISLQIIHLGTSISPNPNTPLDYSQGREQVFNITAQDGNMVSYRFTARIKIPDAFKFTKFSLRGVEGDINTTHNEIIVRLPKGTYLKNIGPNEMEYAFDAASGSDWDEIAPIPGLPIKLDFSDGKVSTYSLQSQSLMYRKVDYNVRVEEIETDGTGKITSFSWDDYPAEINGHTITLYIPEGLTKHDLIDDYPKIGWKGRSIDPNPDHIINSLNDFLTDYVVTDENGGSVLYKVEVKNKEGLDIKKPPKGNKEPEYGEMEILGFFIDGIKADIDEGTNTIYIELPWELDITEVYPEIILPDDCDIYPYNGLSVNLEKSPIFTLKQGDKRKQYKIIYYRSSPEPSTKLWDYFDDEIRDDIWDYQIVE